MAFIYKPKRSSVAGNIPTTSNLVSGEMGVNMADQKIYINNGTSVVQVGSGKLSGLGDVTLTSLASGQTLSWNGTAWVNSSAGAGTVTSVGLTVPVGLAVSGSPVTSSGTLAISLATGYSIPTTASQTNWDSAYSQRLQWDGGSTNLNAATARTSLGLVIGTNVQAWGADLDAIEALAGTSGFLKKTAANTWALDTSTYLTGNQTVTLSGDATGSGATSIAVTLANSGVTAGTYTKITVDAKGRATAGASLASSDVTTALGYTPYNSTNPNGYTSNAGTVTSVSGTGTVSGLTLSGTVSTSGSLTLGGTLSASIDNVSDEYRLFNNMGDSHGTRTAFDAQGAAASVNFGWRFVQGSTNSPGVNSAGQYYSLFVGLGNDYAYNSYGMQVAIPRNVSTPYVCVRYEEGGAFGAWQKINAGYADSAGSATTASTANALNSSNSYSVVNLTASGTITSNSDFRLKEDIVQITHALDKVDELVGCTYRRKDIGIRQVGLIAQDVLEVMPEAVVEGDDGILSVAYGNLVGLLVEAIKELRDEVVYLKATK